jgi:TonB family protein
MNSTVQQPAEPPIAEPHFLLEWDDSADTGRWIRIGILSLVVHLFLGTGFFYVASLPLPKYIPTRTANARRVTPLIAPPVELTQKAPNKAPLSKEFNIESITPHPTTSSVPSPGAAERPSRAAQKFTPPAPTRAPVPSPSMPDSPSIEAPQVRALPPPNPALGTTEQAPPPQIRTEEKPKLAFEKPGTESGSPQGLSRIPAPNNTVDEAIRGAARSRGSHGLILGDDINADFGSAPSPKNSPIPGKLGSNLELLSDPMGVDFWPYLLKVLASVRRNWFAVIPESARLGRGGRVVIQFAIARDGNVPKLVIAMPSGAEALDRAAVAGISASNPFPPLPAEFKGSQIRLQFAFQYSVTPR